MVTFETERLRLRMFRDADLDAYAAMSADPEVMRYLGASGQPLARLDVWRQMAMFLGHWQLRGYGVWAVEERASGTLVGRVGLFNPDGWPGLECIWTLARGAWGKGYATEGARRALEYAFTELDQARVISLIRPGNAASIRVAERLARRSKAARRSSAPRRSCTASRESTGEDNHLRSARAPNGFRSGCGPPLESSVLCVAYAPRAPRYHMVPL